MGEDKGGPGDVADLAGAKLPDPAAPGPQGRGWSGSTRRSTLTRPARPCSWCATTKRSPGLRPASRS